MVIIKGTGLKLDADQNQFIQDKILSIGKFYPQIIDIRVEVEHNLRHKTGKVFRCEANVKLPGKLIRVEKTTTSFEKSVNKVKDHLKVILSKERKKEIDKSKRMKSK